MLKLVFTDRTLTTDIVSEPMPKCAALEIIKEFLKDGKYFLTEIHEVADENS